MTPPSCVQVLIRAYPDTIDWLFDDGSVETTADDISTAAGRLAIATKAEALGFGRRAELFRYLGGRNGCLHGVGAIFPCDLTGLPADRSARSGNPSETPRK